MSLATRSCSAPAPWPRSTSPHGVDRYLEQVNPMWAAHEVRARVVDVHREIDVPGDPRSRRSPSSRPRTWRGHRAGQHVQVGVGPAGAGGRTTRVLLDLQPRLARRASGSRSPCGPHAGRARSRSFLVERGRARPDAPPVPGRGRASTLPRPAMPEHVLLFITGGSGITPVMSMLRTLLRDGYDGRAAAGSRSCTTRDPPSTRSSPTSSTRSAAPATTSTSTCCTPAGDPACRRAASSGWSPATATCDTWACGPAPLIEAGARGVRRPAAARSSTSSPRATARAAAPRATSRSPGPARRPPTPAPPCSSRPRRSG